MVRRCKKIKMTARIMKNVTGGHLHSTISFFQHNSIYNDCDPVIELCASPLRHICPILGRREDEADDGRESKDGSPRQTKQQVEDIP